jgi:putative nucleotidyltransferase with HDIG domain
MNDGCQQAHTRRVTAWCAEIAAKLNLPAPEREVLEQAVPLHQRTKLVVDQAAWKHLQQELGIAVNPHSDDATHDATHDATSELLRSFHGDLPSSSRIKTLAFILDQCDDLDTACEFDATISGEPELNGLDRIAAEVGRYFGGVPASEFERAASRLPVFSAVAYRAIGLLKNIETNLSDVESLIEVDQALAAHIIGAANSASMTSSARVKSVRQAVVRIGMEAARHIVCAALLRKLFESKHSRALWNHSLDVAESAASLATRCGLVDREEAFLAGLMHDVGKLVILNLPMAALESRARLTQSGCPDPIVERILLSEDHASIGARVLRNWRFAESIAVAVENHHRPERNPLPLCSILYLAELSAGQDRGLESAWREELARKRLRIRGNDRPLALPSHTLTSGLRFAAAA